jgi:beta-glucosidase
MFAGGEQTGPAWASVLFGDVSPSGRLPITLPASGEGLLRPQMGDVLYSKGVAGNSVAAFPLGHGLSYTHFEYDEPLTYWMTYCKDCNDTLCFSINITNAGHVTAREIVQVYLEFGGLGRVVQEPKYELRTFQKTSEIRPGGKEMLQFSLSKRDMSMYDEEDQQWHVAPSVKVHVGASSLDIRHSFVARLDLDCQGSSGWRSSRPLPLALANIAMLTWLVWM